MHLAWMWRDQIPENPQPLAGGKPRRIAAEYLVKFGDPSADRSISEQSVLVRGRAAVVVNNDHGPDAPAGGVPVFQGLLAEGIEKFAWDPVA